MPNYGNCRFGRFCDWQLRSIFDFRKSQPFQKDKEITRLNTETSRLEADLEDSRKDFERKAKEQGDKNESLLSEIKEKKEKIDELDK